MRLSKYVERSKDEKAADVNWSGKKTGIQSMQQRKKTRMNLREVIGSHFEGPEDPWEALRVREVAGC